MNALTTEQKVWDSNRLTPQQKLILLALIRYGQEEFPGFFILSQKTQIPEAEVMQIVNEFEGSNPTNWDLPPEWTIESKDSCHQINEEKLNRLQKA